MSLKDQITEDMKAAMRAKDAPRLLTIRGLLAACKQREVDERIVLDDAAVIAIIDKLVKQRKDSITQFTAGNRPDLVEKESRRTAGARRLSAAAPGGRRRWPPRSRRSSPSWAQNSANRADMGKVMGAVKARLAGKADMGLVSAAVKKALPSCITRRRCKNSVPDVCVAPQLDPAAAMAWAAQAGFKSVINNRPDFEGRPDTPARAAAGCDRPAA